MKVLILSHSSDLAGAEQSMLGLFDYWRKATDIEPEFIIRKPLLKLAHELKKRGYKYHTLYYTNWAQRNPTNDPHDIYWYGKQNTQAVSKIERIIKEIQPDVVMTNTLVAPWAAIAAYNQKIPHVWFIREFGDADHGFEFRIGRNKTFEIIGKLSELVVANSKTLAQFALKYIDKTKITILYPFLDIGEIDRLSKEPITNPFKDPGSLKFVITGRIAPSKGQAIAAAAAGILTSQGINCELCIIGSPSDKGDENPLQSAIKKYNIAGKVHLVGYQQNPLAYVALADIGIAASDKEAFGRTTLEYMALGKPVVGSNSGANPELIKTNVNGFLFDPNDPNDLAKTLLKYAKNKQLIYKHGQASRKSAALLTKGQYTPDQLYKKLTQMLSNEPRIFHQTGPGLIEEWKQYPIMISPGTKKPSSKISGRQLYKAAKRLLKTLYLNLN